MRSRSDCTLIAYVASPHDGYLQLFRAYEGSRLGILGECLIGQFPALTRHLPGNRPADAARMIESLGIFSSVAILEPEDLPSFKGKQVVMPDEDVSHALVDAYLPGTRVSFDGSWKLRWDWKRTMAESLPEGEERSSESEVAAAFMNAAVRKGSRSPDWWRQVGCLLARDGEILLESHNSHLPSDQSAYVCGDPRSNFDAGEHIDATLALHAEIALLCKAARRGITTQECDMYVSTFPCPPCAYAIAEAGISRLFYRNGYSLVTGSETLRSRNVRLLRV